MNALDIISEIRLRTNDKTTPTLQLTTEVRSAEMAVFHKLGGFADGDIEAALRNRIDGFVSPSFPHITVNATILIDPVCFLRDYQVKEYWKENRDAVKRFPGMFPAAIIDRNRVSFVGNDGNPPTANDENERLNGIPVSVVYSREPRGILVLGGYSAEFSEDLQVSKRGVPLKGITFTWPDPMPVEFGENELEGATLSLRVSNDKRLDYLIEEHSEGVLKTVYCSPLNHGIEWPQPDYVDRTDAKGKKYEAIIHRSSDLPEKYHSMIVDEFVARRAGGDKK
jgi:hypothetical protein